MYVLKKSLCCATFKCLWQLYDENMYSPVARPCAPVKVAKSIITSAFKSLQAYATWKTRDILCELFIFYFCKLFIYHKYILVSYLHMVVAFYTLVNISMRVKIRTSATTENLTYIN